MSEEKEVEERVARFRAEGKTRPEIVIVDDKEEDRMVLKLALEACDYKVIETDSTKRVDRVLSTQSWAWTPEAFIVDLVLSGSSGYQVIQTFKPRFESKKVPFIVVSSMATEEDIYEAQQSGADAFVIKPFTPHDILDAIAYSIENLRKPIMERASAIYVKRPPEAPSA